MPPRIAWIEDDSAEIYAGLARPDGSVADIYKTFSGRPEAVQAMRLLSGVHFGAQGALTRAQREMIATYVAALLGCHY